MPIQFTCPSCRKALSVPEAYAGATGPCPSCGTQVSVPVLPQAPLQPGTAPAPQAQPIAAQPLAPGAAPPPSPQFATPSAMAGQPMVMPVREAGPRTSPAAIWSLVLSLASYILCLSILSAIPGLILGIVARRSIAASQGRLKGGGMATAGILLSLLAILLTVVVVAGAIVVAPKLSRSVQQSVQQLEIQTNAAQLHMACMEYGAHHGGQLPPDMPTLLRTGYVRPHVVHGGRFEYVGGGRRIDDPMSDRIIVYARRADSRGRRYVVLINGSIEKMPESELRVKLRTQGLPEDRIP